MPSPPPGDLPNPGIEPKSPALQADSLPSEPPGKPPVLYIHIPLIYPPPDGDCSNEIQRRLLLGRKIMTNLDNILKNRDITLPTKVHLVKAIIFPMVMYGYESWTIKKPEH